jgi:hypothetical protein
MDASTAFLRLSEPVDVVRSRLMASCGHGHRPELADLIATARLELEFPGLWVWPHTPGLNAAWLAAKLLTAAVESGLPLEWIRVLETGSNHQGRET